MTTRTARFGWCTVIALVALSALLTACGGSSSPPIIVNPPDPTLLVGVTGLDDYVLITLRPTAGGPDIVFNCEEDGSFSRALAAATYDMVASRPGYDDWGEAAVVVVAEETTNRNPSLTPMMANEYIGKDNCGICHPTELSDFDQAGHSFKLNKVVNDSIPIYPFTSIAAGLPMMADTDDADPADMWLGTENELSTPQSYADISYVIGGYGWKARWIDKAGYIVTGTNVQYNFDLPDIPLIADAEPANMSAYHNNEANKVYNCGNCHTTGWRHYDGPDNMSANNYNPNRQDDLPGMDGTFFVGGVHCEACHGAGSTHAQTMSNADITLIADPLPGAANLDPDMAYGKPRACGDCHTRDGEKDYPSFESAAEKAGWDGPNGGRIAASGGYIKHHEQGDEILGLDPDSSDPVVTTRTANFLASFAHGNCLSCHNPHTTTKHQDNPLNTSPNGVNKTNADCMVCHGDKDPNDAATSGMKGLLCTDCHMPQLVKSARGYTQMGEGRPKLGDIKSHIFTIDLTKDWLDDPDAGRMDEQFTADGSFAYPWITGNHACRTCHNSDGKGPFNLSFSFIKDYKFHND